MKSRQRLLGYSPQSRAALGSSESVAGRGASPNGFASSRVMATGGADVTSEDEAESVLSYEVEEAN